MNARARSVRFMWADYSCQLPVARCPLSAIETDNGERTTANEMNLPREIAWRYLKRPTDALVSAVGFVSVLGLVIGVMALVISMALMTGYRRDLQRKLLGGNAEVFVYSVGAPISDTHRLLQIVGTRPGVAEASPVLFLHALVTTERSSTGSEVMLKGIEPARGRNSPMLAKIG